MRRVSNLQAGFIGLAAAILFAHSSATLALPRKPVGTLPAAPDRSTPEAAVRSFAVALSRGQVARAAACVEGKPTSELYRAWDLQWQQRPSPAPGLTLSDLRTRVKGSAATVSYRVGIRHSGVRAAPDSKEQLSLRKASGGWLIVPLPARALYPSNTPRDTGELRQLATLVIHPELMKDQLARGEEDRCMLNLKRLAAATLILAKDKDYQLAIPAGRLRATLAPRVRNNALFLCPRDHATEGKGSTYSFNTHLEGVSLVNLNDPAKVVLLYEGAQQRLSFRHGGAALVVFADGRVARVGPELAKRLVWAP